MSITPFEMAKYIRNAQALMCAQANNYKSWSDEFVRKECSGIGGWASSVVPVDVTKFTKAEIDELGFGLWDKETGLRLIPLWLYRYLAHGQELKSINGKEKTVAAGYTDTGSPNYIDCDHRGGFIAWGFCPSDRENS